MKWFLTMLIKGYQLTLSSFIGRSCKFYPTCSQYTIEVIEKHGSLKGLFLGMIRIAKCNPWNKGGVDLP